MARKSKSKKTKNKAEISAKELNKKREIQALLLIAFGIFLIIAMFFNITGVAGKAIETFLMGCFGHAGYILPFYLLGYGTLMLLGRTRILRPAAVLFIVLLFLDITILNSLRFTGANEIADPAAAIKTCYASGIELKSGGIIGMLPCIYLVKAIGKAGVVIGGIVLALISVIVISDKPYKDMADWEEKAKERKAIREEKKKEKPERKRNTKEFNILPPLNTQDISSDENRYLTERERKIIAYLADENPGLGKHDEKKADNIDSKIEEVEEYLGFSQPEKKERKPLFKEPEKKEAPKESLTEDDFNIETGNSDYVFPPISLLKKNTPKASDLRSIEEKKRLLDDTFKSFNVDARVVDAVAGPTVTRYEISPNKGVKVSKIVNLQDDIALNLKAKSIRIEAPIPGKAAIGIEVENDNVNMVSIREIIDSDEFKNARSKISFCVGKDIAGNAIVGNLKSMPHLLIAGSTGSGKSVCINSIIASLIYKATPEEVKMILIDPKVVELGNYNGIAHLLIPVVTDPGKAAAALNWAVAEMNNRYKKFAQSGVRDLDSYNDHVRLNDEKDLVMPQIVIIIDELADLMMAAPSQVEESICRLAQMARAAGMHLIVATQRPSVDVITGVIKSNIPSRIAFAVSSQVDSRTILDMGGAEKLVGKGDMLYSPLGMGKPIRVQGCFISDGEVNSIIEFVKKQSDNEEKESEILKEIENQNPSELRADSGDDLFDDCVEFILQAGQASVSMLQRRFRIGYNRAARIMDMMEERKIVGPPDGARPRQVLLSLDEYKLTQNNEEEESK